MRNADRPAGGVADRPILPWTIVAGAFAHFVIPIYVVSVLVACLLGAPSPPSVAGLLAIAVPFSVRFVLGYAVLTFVAALAARAVDPVLRSRRRRRERTVPSARAAASARDCRAAVRRARPLLGTDARASLDAIDAASWDYGDDAYRAIAADLVQVVDAAANALAHACGDRQRDIVAVTIGTLDRIATALDTLADERRRLDEGDVATIARYVQTRYGPSDFAGDDDR